MVLCGGTGQDTDPVGGLDVQRERDGDALLTVSRNPMAARFNIPSARVAARAPTAYVTVQTSGGCHCEALAPWQSRRRRNVCPKGPPAPTRLPRCARNDTFPATLNSYRRMGTHLLTGMQSPAMMSSLPNAAYGTIKAATEGTPCHSPARNCNPSSSRPPIFCAARSTRRTARTTSSRCCS